MPVPEFMSSSRPFIDGELNIGATVWKSKPNQDVEKEISEPRERSKRQVGVIISKRK